MLNSLAWLGSVSGIIGAILVASNNGYQMLGYVAFLLGSLAWLPVCAFRKDNAALVQWVVFSMINTYGLFNYAN